jgi:HEAT repeat protein/tetratricopeptide (TPR) repeat protein
MVMQNNRVMRGWLALGSALLCFWIAGAQHARADEVTDEQTAVEEKMITDLTADGVVDEKRLTDVLKRYREIREELARIDAEKYPFVEQTKGVQLMFESPGFVTAYLGGDQKQIRVFAVRMILVNPTNDEMTLNGRAVELDEDGKTHAYKALNPQLTNYSVNVGDGYPSLKALVVAESVTVPAKGLAATWLVFQDLDEGNHVPELSVKVPMGEGTQTVNLNDFFHAMLKVRLEKIGPKDCLALMTIHGEATSIGLSALVDTVDEMSAHGLSRLVIEWASDSVPIDQSIRNTFLQSIAQHGKQEYGDEGRFLGLPEAITELAVIVPDDKSFEAISYSNDGTARFFRWASEASTQVLASAYELTNDDDLIDEIRDGHPYSKMAGMRLAGTRLAVQQLPMLLEYASHKDAKFRSAAYVALSYIDHPLAQETLLKAARATDDSSTAEEAIRCLLMSPHIRMQDQVLVLLKEENLDVRQRAMKTISAHPQNRWRDQIEQLLVSPSVEVRIQALKALAQIGHPELQRILLDHLKHEDSKIRREAFVQLSSINDPRLERVLTSYCLANIESNSSDSQLLSYLTTHKPHAAIGPLKKLYQKTSENRAPLISALISLGDYDTFDMLIDGYDKLKNNEERDALLTIGVVSTSHYQRLVRMMLERYQPDTDISLGHLLSEIHYYADGETLETLISFVGKWERNPKSQEGQLAAFISQAINAISQLSNTRSRVYLADLVLKTDNKLLRDQALTAISNSFQNSPGYNISHETEQYLRDKNFTKAMKIANLAIEHDDESPHAYSVRGDCYYHQAEIEKAIVDYSRALALNPAMNDVFLKRSDCYLIQNNIPAAEADLKQAGRLRENRVDVNEALGQLYRRTGQLDQAMNSLKKAVEKGPKTSRGVTAQATILMYENGPIAAIEFLKQNQESHQASLSFQYTSAALYAIASKSVEKDDDQENNNLIEEYRAASLQLLKKLDSGGSCKVKLMSGDPAFGGLDQVEGFKSLFEKHGKSKVAADAVGAISPVKSSSYSASIEVGKKGVISALHEVETPAKDPQLVSGGEVLLLAPPK